ncbi:MAG: hypothetical protein K0R89_635 [Ramlibacter sp.]|nr:hypothetical protein [Ramlibacter sp.]
MWVEGSIDGMHQDPVQVLRGALRGSSTVGMPRLVIAGATGALGNEVLRRLVGGAAFRSTQVLAREPITAGLRGVEVTVVPPGDPSEWPRAQADVGVVLFDPPRLFYDRERALWTPAPGQLPALARWMRASGVRTLAVVLPHAPGRLPEALKRGLANLDEQAIASLGFDRLLILRSAQKPAESRHASAPARLAHWMLSIFKYMVPSSEQPVRAVKVAELLSIALRLAPPGIHVAAPEVVWEAAQGQARAVAARWLGCA